MENELGYAGKQVVVSGGASGMGAALVGHLVEVGAEVTVFDVKPCEVAGIKESRAVDLRSEVGIAEAAASVAGNLDALFSCAGIAGGAHSDAVDVLAVNFIGGRELVERLVPKMPPGSGVVCICSTGSFGWEKRLPEFTELVTSESFTDAVSWCRAHADRIRHPYGYSKQVLNAWVAWRSASLIKDGIRLNCINPAPTETPLMSAFIDHDGRDVIEAALGPIGRLATPDEQAWALLLVNSPRLSYVTGVSLATDGGFGAAVASGQMKGFEVP